MKRVSILLIVCTCALCTFGQFINNSNQDTHDLSSEVARLKEMVKQLQENELQSDKLKYQKNYQLILNGLESLKEMQQGIMEINGARSQNILYKKLIDINNPTSEALGFQLIDVINKTLDENITALVHLAEGDRRRLRGQVSGLFEGLKRTFPPLQIITSCFSAISSFSTYKTRLERIGRKADSIVVDVMNPISQEVIGRMSGHLQPYIHFYNDLNKVNSAFETALYQHEVEYRDYIEEVMTLKQTVEKKINLGESISEQVISMFDLANSSAQNFDFKNRLEHETIKELAGQCMNIFELVDRYKKFTNDFITIQDDFYRNNLAMLTTKAKNLPYKDVAKIDQLANELQLLKNGNTNANTMGFDMSYKLRLKGIMAKLYAVNKLRM